jgi:hypothetical protein
MALLGSAVRLVPKCNGSQLASSSSCPAFSSVPYILFFYSLRGLAFWRLVLGDGGDLGDFIVKSTHPKFLSTICVCGGVVFLPGLVQVRLLYF